MKDELKYANLKFSRSVAGMSPSDGSAWQQLKEAQEELQRQHGVAMSSIRGAGVRE